MLYDRVNGALLLVVQALKNEACLCLFHFLLRCFSSPLPAAPPHPPLLAKPAHGSQAEDRPLSTRADLRGCGDVIPGCAACSQPLQSVGQGLHKLAPPVQRPGSRIETCSRKGCWRLTINSFATCTNCCLSPNQTRNLAVKRFLSLL